MPSYYTLPKLQRMGKGRGRQKLCCGIVELTKIHSRSSPETSFDRKNTKIGMVPVFSPPIELVAGGHQLYQELKKLPRAKVRDTLFPVTCEGAKMALNELGGTGSILTR